MLVELLRVVIGYSSCGKDSVIVKKGEVLLLLGVERECVSFLSDLCLGGVSKKCMRRMHFFGVGMLFSLLVEDDDIYFKVLSESGGFV